MNTEFKNQLGFTLIEMLIVIVVLGILAMIIVPQIGVSTDDAKLRTLQTNLSGIRSAVETYYAQHKSTYPGENDEADGSTIGTGGHTASADAFIDQLTLYTDADGVKHNVKELSYKYGPYIKGGKMPRNPYTDTYDVTCDIDEDNITVRTADVGTLAWKFYPKTGVFIANDTLDHADY
jgi:prepilin-type N-terminal cleavage/methylation domain-containing protein